MKDSKHIAILRQAESEFLTEIVKAAELRLATQVSLAIAADQRAMTFLGFMLTIDVFLLGSAIAAATATTPYFDITLTASVAAVGFFVAAIYAYKAGAPSPFHVSGLDPEDWSDDIAAGLKYENTLPELAEFYNRAIAENRALMKSRSEDLKTSSIVAALTIVASSMIAVMQGFW